MIVLLLTDQSVGAWDLIRLLLGDIFGYIINSFFIHIDSLVGLF